MKTKSLLGIESLKDRLVLCGSGAGGDEAADQSTKQLCSGEDLCPSSACLHPDPMTGNARFIKAARDFALEKK